MSLERMPSTSRRVLRATARTGAGLCVLLVLPVLFAGGDTGDLVDRIEDQGILLGVAAAILLWWLVYWIRRRLYGRRVARAAEIAAADDPDFAADIVRSSAAVLFERVQHAWDTADRAALKELTSPALFDAWCAALDENERNGLRHHTKVVELTSVEYLGIVNHDGEHDDLVTVRICSKLRDYYVGRDGEVLPNDDAGSRRSLSGVEARAEFWTLVKCANGNGWVLDSIDDDEQRSAFLRADVVAGSPDRAAARDAFGRA